MPMDVVIKFIYKHKMRFTHNGYLELLQTDPTALQRPVQQQQGVYVRPSNPWEAGPGMVQNLAAVLAAQIKSDPKWTVKSAPLEFYSILPNFQPQPLYIRDM
jgi:hypothetical protein